MAEQLINIAAKVNTTEVKRASADFAELKGKVSELAKEVPGLGPGFANLTGHVGEARAMMQGLVGVIGGLPAIVGAAAIAFSGLGVAMAFRMADVIDGFGDMGERLGLSADQAYYLSTAAQQAGSSLGALTAMGDRLSRAMSNSGDEMKGAGLALSRLGVESQGLDGKLRSTADVAQELLEKWEGSAKTASDYADMQQLLGKNFEENLPVLKAVIDASNEANEMYEAGIGITKRSLEVTAEQEKQQRALGAVFNSMGSILVETVIPSFNSLVEWFVKSYKEGGIVANVFTGIAISTEVLMVGIKVLIAGFMTITEAITITGRSIGAFGAAIARVLSGDFSGAFGIVKELFGEIDERVQGVGKSIGKLDVFAMPLTSKFLNGESVINKGKGELQKPTGNALDRIFKGGAGGEVRPEKDKNTKEAKDPIEALIESLQRQVIATENLNKVDQISAELQDKKFEKSDPLLKQKARDLALTLDNANATKLLTAATAATVKIADDYVDSLQDEIRARTTSRRDMQQDMQLRRLDRQLQEDLKRLKDAGLLSIARENDLLKANAEAKRRVTEATKTANAADADWFGRGIDQYIKNVGKFDDALANLVSGSLDKLSDGLTELLTGGSFSFKEFAASIIKELIKMIIQFTILIPIVNALKAALQSNGGWGGLFASIFSSKGNAFTDHHANGVASSATGGFFNGNASVYGEAGDEAIMPLKRNAAGDLGIVAHASGGQQSISQVNNITVNGGSNGNKEDDAALAKNISTMIDRRFNENLMKARRPGGMLNQVSMAF